MCNHKWMSFGSDGKGNYRQCIRCGEKRYITTNADRIRSMSDEQMAKELIDMIMELCEDGVPCYDFALEWFRRPAEED